MCGFFDGQKLFFGPSFPGDANDFFPVLIFGYRQRQSMGQKRPFDMAVNSQTGRNLVLGKIDQVGFGKNFGKLFK